MWKYTRQLLMNFRCHEELQQRSAAPNRTTAYQSNAILLYLRCRRHASPPHGREHTPQRPLLPKALHPLPHHPPLLVPPQLPLKPEQQLRQNQPHLRPRDILPQAIPRPKGKGLHALLFIVGKRHLVARAW